MTIPNANKAEISPTKLRDYLLNPIHRRGGPKARLLLAHGYRAEEWERLEADLRHQHLTLEVTLERHTDYGRRFEIAGPLIAPDGLTLFLRSIWQIDTGKTYPRLITMYPEQVP